MKAFLLLSGLSFLSACSQTAFIVRDVTTREERTVGNVDAPHRPWSTYKIPNTLIGLDTGVIPDEHFTLKWDGVHRDNAAWNRDQDLTSALQQSTVWYFQEVARRVGKEREQSGVNAFSYGNRDTCCQVDTFWLDGKLMISPRQQVDFLAGLTDGSLHESPEHTALVRRILTLEQTPDHVIAGKSGTGDHEAWLVGWLERGGHTWVWALYVEGTPSRAKRLELVKAQLRSLHLM